MGFQQLTLLLGKHCRAKARKNYIIAFFGLTGVYGFLIVTKLFS